MASKVTENFEMFSYLICVNRQIKLLTDREALYNLNTLILVSSLNQVRVYELNNYNTSLKAIA